MRKLVSIAIVVAATAAAHADAPKVDAVKAAAAKWTDAIALPFTYQGVRMEAGSDCESAFGTHGVVKDAKKLDKFVACVKASDAKDAFLGTSTVAVFDPKHIAPELDAVIDNNAGPPLKEVQKGYPAKLSKLAKTGGLYVVHGTKPDNVDDYWDEAWDFFVAHDDGGTVKFDAIVVELSEQSPD